MKRRLFALALALLLAVSLPVSALARDLVSWMRATSPSVPQKTVRLCRRAIQHEADDAPVIKQKDSSKSTSNTITIDAEERHNGQRHIGRGEYRREQPRRKNGWNPHHG